MGFVPVKYTFSYGIRSNCVRLIENYEGNYLKVTRRWHEK